MKLLYISLAIVWAIYGVSWARNRREQRGGNSISNFRKHLSVLERATPAARKRLPGSPAPLRSTVSLARPAFAPTSRQQRVQHQARAPRPLRPAAGLTRSQARLRRLNILRTLAGAAVATLVLTVLAGGPFLYLQVLADLLLTGYVLVLVRTTRLAVERRAKVHYLRQPVAVDIGDLAGSDDGAYADQGHVLLQQSAN